MECRILKIQNFLTFLLNALDILSWDIFHFWLCFNRTEQNSTKLYSEARSQSPFTRSYAPFRNAEYWKNKIFRPGLWLAETFWAELLASETLLNMYFTDQLDRKSSISTPIFVGVMSPFRALEYRKYKSFPHFSGLHALTYWAETFFIWLCPTELPMKFENRQFPSILVGVMPLLKLRILKIRPFTQVCVTCFGPIELKFCKMALFYWPTDQARVSLICVTSPLRVMPLLARRFTGNTVDGKQDLLRPLTIVELKFYIWLRLIGLKIKFEWHNSVSVWLFVCPSIFCTSPPETDEWTHSTENLFWQFSLVSLTHFFYQSIV